MRAATEVEAGTDADHELMRTSYAITWQRAGEAPRSGRLELAPRALDFEGSNGAGSESETIPYEDVTGVRIARASGDRLAGRQTLVLDRRSGDPIRIASIVHPGIISELAERLASLHAEESAADVNADRSRLVDRAYSLVTAQQEAEYVSFEATPGPGDSEGGDLF
jgi:hypothetical protein